jgi:hypothetical protein
MVRTKLPPHINGFVDRYGRARFYVRRPGHKNVRLPGLPWSAEFMTAYAEAVEGQEPTKIGEKRSPAGTVAATVGLYLGSTAFNNLAAETQRNRRNILERFREEHGDKRIAAIEKKHVQAMVTAKGATPQAARNFLIALRAVIAFAIDAGIRADDDPTLGVKRPKIKTEGYRTWTEDDIAPLLPPENCALIVTAQRRIAVAGVARVDLELLAEDEAVGLLRSIMGKGRPVATASELSRIAELCGLLPLALRVAGMFLVTSPHRSVAEFIAALSDERKRLGF